MNLTNELNHINWTKLLLSSVITCRIFEFLTCVCQWFTLVAVKCSNRQPEYIENKKKLRKQWTSFLLEKKTIVWVHSSLSIFDFPCLSVPTKQAKESMKWNDMSLLYLDCNLWMNLNKLLCFCNYFKKFDSWLPQSLISCC